MSPRNASSRFSHLPVLFAFVALCALAIVIPSLALSSRAAEAAPYVTPPPGGIVAVSPTNLTNNCRHCNVTVSNTSASNTLIWSTTGQGVGGITVNPPSGRLAPHGQTTAVITIPASTACPANARITFSGQNNSVNVFWSCSATPTPTPSPTPSPSPTPIPSPSPTASLSPSPTDSLSTDTPTVGPTSSTTPTTTATASSVVGNGQQNNGNPPTSNGGGSGGSALSILFTVAGLLLGVLAFLLYLIPSAHSSLRTRLLSLVMPVSMARRIE